MPRIEANPTPSVLIWARESAGLSIELAAKKAGIASERLTAWEAGKQRPTFAQLRTLARIYKRPLAAFYLTQPPQRFEAMHDFRRMADANEHPFSPELTVEIRKARDRREWALDLYRDLEEEPPQFDTTVAMDQDNEQTAEHVRELLGITVQTQSTWRTQYDAFRQWRLAIERFGVLTFQANNVEVVEVRGFSIADRPMPVAVVNIKDAPRGRIFTL